MYADGLDLVRSLIARGLAASPADAVGYAARRWGRDSNAVRLVKAAVSDTDTADLLDSGLLAAASAEFMEAVAPMSIVGRLAGVRRVAPNTPYCPNSAAAVGYWRGQSKPIKASRLAFTRTTLPALSVGALTLATREALEAEGRGDELMRRDLVRAVAAATDEAFIDSSNAGSAGVTPAAVTNGASSVSSSGNVANDLGAALEAFAGDLTAAAWIMHPRTVADIVLRTGGIGIGSDLGVRGGSLLGLPVFTSESVPVDSSGAEITLLDASAIALIDEGIVLSASQQATIELSDSPTGATDTPVSASASAIVSAFQEDGVVFKAVRAANWSVGRTGGVVVITGADYTEV